MFASLHSHLGLVTQRCRRVKAQFYARADERRKKNIFWRHECNKRRCRDDRVHRRHREHINAALTIIGPRKGGVRGERHVAAKTRVARWPAAAPQLAYRRLNGFLNG